MNCLLVINRLSGNASKIRAEALIEKYAPQDVVSVKYIDDLADTYALDGIDKLIVCGGDGTLHHALNLCRDKEIDLYYLPCGTFNETAKARRGAGIFPLSKSGRLQDTVFSYVAAAGSFTEIGSLPSAKSKRRFKIFAYFLKVLSAYKAHRIPASFDAADLHVKDAYTLIMISDAARCFGFRFNRMHREDSDELQLLLIRAPKRDDLFGRIKIFFPFFRAFFIGFSKPYRSKNILFTSLRRGVLSLPKPTLFCVDGEKVTLSGDLTAEKLSHKARIYVVKD